MRPTTLELKGFASFRQRTTVDFGDADLFVLAGPTGAGKSSVIDALGFSLYGSVPRYDDKRAVAPVISQGLNEAKVRLTFEVDDRTYTATRVVRRTKTGATTKEARLERIDPADGAVVETLAGSAAELTEAVEDLLGLSFEHFVRTVVLPQGAFQEFLHATGKERQDLLVELLDLDVYRRIASRARERAKEAATEAGLLRKRLDGPLHDATEDSLDAARDRVATLEELQAELAEATPRLDELTERGGELGARAEAARERAAEVAAIEAPDGVTALTDRRSEAATALEEAKSELQAAVDARESVEEQRDDLPEAGQVRSLRDAVASEAALADQLESAEQKRTTAAEARAAAAEAEEAAGAAVAAAREAVQQAERADLGATLAEGLAAGDLCPVCDRPLDEEPHHEVSTDLAAARARLAEAEDAEARARETLQSAVGAAEAAATKVEATRERLDDTADRISRLTTELAGPGEEDPSRFRDPDVLSGLEERIRAAAEAHKKARSREQRARTAVEEAEQRLAKVDEAHAAAWQTFDTTRDRVAGLEPPPADRDDLAGSWAALVDWAAERRPELESAATEAERAVEEARGEYRALAAELRQACRDHDVEVADGQSAGEACAAALASARDRAARLAEQVEEAARIRKEVSELEAEQRVAHELGRHLRSSNFEGWLLTRALRRLVVGATEILHDLTDRAYSLTLDDGNAFAVVDHRNADEVRSARTLSGGETFLASLSLALALSEHVADLAAGGSARLDALFLDEGFGTLDAATLDTVATAIEELGSRGRMVGVITHVRELAERVPVRYEVRKTLEGSTIEKVVA